MNKKLLTALMITAIGVATLTGYGRSEEDKAAEAVTQIVEENLEIKEETVEETDAAVETEPENNEEVPEEKNKTIEAYEEKKSEVLSAVDRCKINKDINGALKILYDAREEYPEDEFFFELQQKLRTCQPDYIEENCNIIRKKGCKVGLDTIELDNGERVTEDFSINFGGGNIVLDLSEQYKVVDLKVFLSNMAPSKGLIDIDFVCDGVVMDRIKGFDVNCDLIEKSIDVTGVNVFEISVIDCTHDWVGEASFSKPDAECHFTFRAYTEKSIEWR